MIPLPIDEALPRVIAVLDHDGSTRPRSVVLVAPTGAGKTTRVAPAIAPIVRGTVVMTEPRRVVARAAARRIASEQGTSVGDAVGYQVRFDSRVGPRTSIVVATEGVLVRRVQDDPLLEGIGAVVFDEFHERHVDTDVGLALVRQVQREVRPDLAIVVMSATLDAAPVARWLGDAPVVESQGRSFSVDVTWQPRVDERPLEVQVAEAVRQAVGTDDGNVLAFLPGVGEIERARRELGGLAGARVVTLHGRMSGDDQDDAIAPGGGRKVILATNIAESSLTVPGVTTVIDSGLARVLRFDPAVGLDRLVLERISKASAAQRAGRAGRERPGRCVRLWPSSVEQRMAVSLESELHRADLSGVALQLAAWGADPTTFDWFDPPDPPHWAAAHATLEQLGCTRGGRITTTGKQVATLPVAPRLGRLLVEGVRLGVASQAAAAAAVLADRDVTSAGDAAARNRPTDSDLADRVALVTSGGRHPADLAARALPGPIADARRVASQLERLAGRLADTPPPADAHEATLRAIFAGFPDRVALRRAAGAERAIMVGGTGVRLHHGTALAPDIDLFVCVDLAPPERGTGGDARVRSASRVERAWLTPDRIFDGVDVFFDADVERVAARRTTRYLDLVLDTRPTPVPPGSDGSALLAEAARARPERALTLDAPAFARLRARVAWLREADPTLELPDIDGARLLDHLDELCVGAASFAELRAVDLEQWARARFPYRAWQRLDALAPDSLPIPSGRDARLRYEVGSPPILAARIQELFGLHDTPRVLGGRVPVLVHLLAPNMRPQQITQDLRSFWETGYAAVRRELRARYPKHAWPEDPWHAPAERKPGRHR